MYNYSKISINKDWFLSNYNYIIVYLIAFLFIGIFLKLNILVSILTILLLLYTLKNEKKKKYSLAIPIIIYFFSIFFPSLFYNFNYLFWNKFYLKLSIFAFGIILAYLYINTYIYNKIFYFINILTSISIVYTLYALYNNYTFISSSMLTGGSIISPFNDHIRYGLFLIFVLILNFDNFFYKNKSKYLVLFDVFMILTIIGTLVILSIRSSLILLFFLLIYYFIKILFNKKSILNYILIFIIFLISLIALNTKIFQNKISYTLWEMKMNNLKKHTNYSYTNRIASIKCGIELIKENKFLGIGLGNIENKSKEMYIKKGYTNPIIPHNQFIVDFATSGIFFGSLLFFYLIFLIYNAIKYKNEKMILFLICAIFIIFIEPMFEIQYGIILFFLPLIIFKYNRSIYE